MEAWDLFYLEQMNGVMKSDGLTTSHANIQYVESSYDADFGSITYQRGSSMNR